MYRLQEAIMHNGEAIKALINEEFGDGECGMLVVGVAPRRLQESGNRPPAARDNASPQFFFLIFLDLTMPPHS